MRTALQLKEQLEKDGKHHGERLIFELFNLRLVEDYFIGKRIWKTNPRAIYGGELMAQSLLAARKIVPSEFHLHSFNAYFVTFGSNESEVIYQGRTLTAGKTIQVLQMKALQNEETRLTLTASFKKEEPNSLTLTRSLHGHAIADDVPINLDSLPKPNELMNIEEILMDSLKNSELAPTVREGFLHSLGMCNEFPCEVKPCNPLSFTKQVATSEAQCYVWMRVRNCPENVKESERQACLVYMSDMGILRPLFLKYPFFKTKLVASLNHSTWFHEVPLENYHPRQWALFEFTCEKAAKALILSRSRVYNRDGVHLASFAQEGIYRPEVNPDEMPPRQNSSR